MEKNFSLPNWMKTHITAYQTGQMRERQRRREREDVCNQIKLYHMNSIPLIIISSLLVIYLRVLHPTGKTNHSYDSYGN